MTGTARGRPARGAAAPASLLLALLALPTPLRAHDGRPIEPHDLWAAWSWEPWVVLGLALSGVLYARGALAIRRRVRGRAEAAYFAAGWVLLAAALLSPLHALGGVLFSAHMAQHELLMVAAAPLLVLGRPVVPWLWALPASWRRAAGAAARRPAVRGAWDALTAPLAATVVHGAAIWAWHLPALYEASLASEGAHTTQHLTFLGTGLLFWWAFLRGGARRQRAAAGPAVLCLFFTTLHTGVLGAVLTFSRSLWYPSYGATTAPWGLMPLDDQQLAGLIMWIPGGIAYTIAGLAFLARVLREDPRLVNGVGAATPPPVPISTSSGPSNGVRQLGSDAARQGP